MKTCPICGKNDLKHQGALNIHMYHCKMKNVSRETGNQEKPKLEECEHDFRFLIPSMPIEKRAMQHGYKEVCKKCQEVK